VTPKFCLEREVLTQRMSSLSPHGEGFLQVGVVDEFNKGLDEILN
jgi:hypothetical protein